jgi:hypothetical protein
MTDSPNLGLPYIDTGQAQKEVTHNTALATLDILAQATAINASTTAPPGAPTDGQAWIVGVGATGAWAGKDRQIAAWFGGWRFYPPKEGWLCYDQALNVLVVYDGAAWVLALAGAIVRAADGAAATPGIAFDQDTDTGLYRIGANDIGFATGGTLRLRLDGSGVLRLVSGNMIFGTAGSGTGAGGVVLAGGYVGLKSDDGADRLRVGKLGTDNRVLIDLYDTAGASAVVVRDSSGADMVKLDSDGNVDFQGEVRRNGVKLLAARDTGWTAFTGTASKGGFATGTVTLTQLAQVVKALQDALTAHGIVGA